MSEYPLVSIVTPSYNQAQFITYTIDSVLNQDYPNLECIVVDGGSTDGTVDILEQYRQKDSRLSYVSEPDRGQSHAINKGIAMAKGDIIGWLNSDDTYIPGAIRKAVHALNTHVHWSMVYGNANVINEHNEVLSSFQVQSYDLRTMFEICCICQPAAFLRKQTLIDVGGIDESYDFCMDYNLWIRIGKQHLIGYVNDYWANHRVHEQAKGHTSFGTIGISEIFRTSKEFYGDISNTWVHYYVMFHREQGAAALVNNLKPYHIFGPSPAIRDTNVAANVSIPDIWSFQINNDKENPLSAFAIRGVNTGRVRASCFAVYDNHVSPFSIPNGMFELIIPISSNKEYFSLDFYIQPSNGSLYNQDPELGSDLRLTNYVPLSRRELQFYNAFISNPFEIEDWLKQHRIVTPHY